MKTFAIFLIMLLGLCSHLLAQTGLTATTSLQPLVNTMHTNDQEMPLPLKVLLELPMEVVFELQMIPEKTEISVFYKKIEFSEIDRMSMQEIYSRIHSIDEDVVYKSIDMLSIIAMNDIVVVDGKRIPTYEVNKKINHLFQYKEVLIAETVHFYDPAHPYDPKTIISLTTKP